MHKLILSFFIILSPLLVFPQWGTINTGSTTNFNSIYVVDSLTVLAVGDSGVILRTVNGGLNWNRQSAELTFENLTSVFFITNSLGYITGQNGILLKTTNGGSQWQKTTISTWNLNDIYFKNTSNGFIVSENGIIYKTIDGGSNWTEIFSGTTYFLNSIRFTDEMNGFIVGNNGTLLKTSDGGINWQNINTQITNSLNDVYFITKDSGLLVGLNQTILKTYNGSQSFTPISTTLADYYYSIRCFNNLDCFITGNKGTIIKVDKMGNISKEYGNGTNSIKSIGFYNNYIGYTAGTNGLMLKTCPVADFSSKSYNDTTNFSGNVLFTNQSRNYSEQTWFFGDGNSSIEKNPIYNYKKIGDYEVKLIIKNQTNCTDTITKTIKVIKVLGLTEEMRNANILITPNPFSESFSLDITLSDSYIKVIEIYNPSGRSVYKRIIEDKYFPGLQLKLERELNDLTSGIYFLCISTDKNIFFRKVIKIKSRQ